MSNRLDQFINENREDFDDEMPSSKVWDNIQHKVFPEKKMEAAPVVKMNFMKWSIAAAAIVLVALGAWILIKANNNTVKPEGNKEVAKVTPTVPEKTNIDTVKVAPEKIETTTPKLAAVDPKKEEIKKDAAADDPEAIAKEEMYHFAKLVEIKHRELKTMSKDEPMLYKQFAGDVNKLDSVYHSLENKLSIKENSEEVLEAMIQNLQLQMQLLNHQLQIIKQLNHSKKSAYDKAYQSI